VRGKWGMEEREEGRKEKHYLPIYLLTYLSIYLSITSFLNQRYPKI
jgi:hypothetical protein